MCQKPGARKFRETGEMAQVEHAGVSMASMWRRRTTVETHLSAAQVRSNWAEVLFRPCDLVKRGWSGLARWSRSDLVEVESNLVEIESDLVITESNLVEIEPDLVVTESDLVKNEPDLIVTESDLVKKDE